MREMNMLIEPSQQYMKDIQHFASHPDVEYFIEAKP